MFDQRVDARQREQIAHDVRRVAQVGDGFEQRNHHQAVVRGIFGVSQTPVQQAGFLLQQHHFDQIADGFRVRNDVVAHRARAELLARHAGRFEHAEFALREIGVVEIRQTQRPRLRQFAQQQRDLVGFGQRRVIVLRRPRA